MFVCLILCVLFEECEECLYCINKMVDDFVLSVGLLFVVENWCFLFNEEKEIWRKVLCV